MKQYVLWLILLQLCCGENLDYIDYHPETIPLQAENPSPGYEAVMKNLCNNWHSPISYLKKRGYMPNNIEYAPKVNPQKKVYHENIEQGENYFFFPDNKKQRNSIILLENEEASDKSNAEEVSKAEQPKSPESPSNEKAKNDGIIKKVKDKFLSIFSHKDKSKGDQAEELFDIDNPEFLENYNDDYYELSNNRRLVTRSVSTNEDILSNLTETEIHFIKSFINWFKQNKDDFKIFSSSSSNKTTPGNNSDLKDGESKTSSPKPENTKSNETKEKVQNTTETVLDKNLTSSTKSGNLTSSTKSGNSTSSTTSGNATSGTNLGNLASSTKSGNFSSSTNSENMPSECFDTGSVSSTTAKTAQAQNIGSSSKNYSSTSDGKNVSNDFTVDLDINQKNGTGEEIPPKTKNECVLTLSSTPIPQSQNSSDRNKYLTKLMFLAHLHHMVDEVGKPRRKPLDLEKVQNIIDNSKKIHTVTMGGDKTTECAPLRLNDMSFDLEWNKINTVPQNNREKMKTLDLPFLTLDLPYDNQPQGQSLAAKFLQEVSSYPGKSDEYLQTPYADNFLDSQQSLPIYLGLPVKTSTKREVGLPSFGKKMELSSYPEADNADEYFSDVFRESPKRRIKGRIKGRNKPKPKQTNKIQSQSIDELMDISDDMKERTDFDSFDELRDIQFRVNSNDEEAISTFISNLNSPPEVFSFDVDKYLRSAKENMEPKAPEFEFQSPEPRTYYEFMEAPAIENERLPLIEEPSSNQMQSAVDKRSKASLEKRDLLRQYIKGVSSALNHNFEDIYCEDGNKKEKLERSPNLDSEITRTSNVIDEFSSNSDAVDDIKSNDNYDLQSNYFLLNEAMDVPKQDAEAVPYDYSPQSLEIDLDLDKKFRDLNIGRYNNEPSRNFASADLNDVDIASSDNRELGASDIESMDSESY